MNSYHAGAHSLVAFNAAVFSNGSCLNPAEQFIDALFASDPSVSIPFATPLSGTTDNNEKDLVHAVTQNGVAFVFGVCPPEDATDWRDCRVRPTAVLQNNDGTQILVWAFEVLAKPEQAQPLADALGMESLDELIPTPAVDGWTLVHADVNDFVTLAQMNEAYLTPVADDELETPLSGVSDNLAVPYEIGKKVLETPLLGANSNVSLSTAPVLTVLETPLLGANTNADERDAEDEDVHMLSAEERIAMEALTAEVHAEFDKILDANPPKSFVPKKVKGATEPENYGMYGDAICKTEYDENDYLQKLTISEGAISESKDWKPKTQEIAAFNAKLCKHREGKKDGPAFVLGDIVPGRRLKNSVIALYGIGIDIDTGTPSATIDAALLKLGCLAVRYTTHSHGKTRTEIKKDNIVKYAGGRDIDDGLVREFLRCNEEWDPDLVETVEYVGTDHTDAGIVCVVEHEPMAKNRVIIPLATAFEIAKEGVTQAEAIKKWALVVEKTADLLGIPFDRACTDPSRLFYYPRHVKGKPFEISLFGGPLFDFHALELESDADRLVAEISTKGSKSVTPEGRALGRWSVTKAHGFQIADVITNHCHEHIRAGSGDKFEILCPFDDNHSNAGDQDDRACFVQNAASGMAEIFVISCRHETCRDKTNLDMLGKMVADGWFERSVLDDEQYNAILEDAPCGGRYSTSTKSFKSPADDGNDDAQGLLCGEIRSAIEHLKKDSPSDAIGAAVAKITKIENPILKDDLVRNLKKATGRTQAIIDEALKYASKTKVFDNGFGARGQPGLELKADQKRALNAIEKKYQPPVAYGDFAYGEFDERFWLYRWEKKSKGDADDEEFADGKWVRLCTPFSILAGVDFPDRDVERGLRVIVQDGQGKDIEYVLETSLAYKSGGADLKTKLNGAGCGMTPQGELFVLSQFKQNVPADPIQVYDRPGWKGTAFLTAFGVAINTNRRIELSGNNMPEGEAQSGEKDTWIDAADAAMQSGNLSMQIGVLAGAGSPLIEMGGYDSMVVAFTGVSSQGKTTGLKESASWWGSAVAKKGLFGNFNGTVKSSEALLERGSGCGWGYDEAHLIDGDELQRLIYKTSGNSGADRLDCNADLKDTRSWSLMMLISGEHSFTEKLRQCNAHAATGLGVRALEINCDDQKQLSAEQIIKIESAYQNVGHAGPAFVRHMISTGYDRERLRTEIDELVAKLVPADAPPMVKRSAQIAAVLWKSGELMQAAGLLKKTVNVEAVARAIWAKAQESEISAADPVGTAVKILFENLISKRGGDVADWRPSSKQYNGEDGEESHVAFKNSLAWRVEDESILGFKAYVVPVLNLQKLSGGQVSEKLLSREMRKRGLLAPKRGDGKANVWEYVPGLGKIASIVIPLDRIEGEAPPPEGAKARRERLKKILRF